MIKEHEKEDCLPGLATGGIGAHNCFLGWIHARPIWKFQVDAQN